MAKQLCLIFADAHLRVRRGDEQYAFEQVIDAAIRLKVPIIGAGDLLDKQTNRAESIVFLSRQLRRLHEAGLLFYYIEGQHEADAVPWLSFAPNAVHLHKEIYLFGDYTVYGLNYQPIGKLQDEFALIPPDVDILVCHQVWADWMGDLASPQGGFHEVPEQIVCLISGDLHQTKIERHRNAGAEDMLCCSPGATCQQKIDEPAQHFYILLDEFREFTRHPLKSRVFIDWSLLLTSEDVDLFVSGIEPALAQAAQKWAAAEMPEALRKPYLRVTYSHRLNDVQHRIEQIIGDRAFVTYKEVPPEEKATAVAARVASGKAVTPRLLLDEVLSPVEDPDGHALAARLLETNDVPGELTKWKTEYLGTEDE